MLARLASCLVILALAGFLTACDESLKTLAGPTPDLEPTFTAIKRDVFQTTDTAGRTACVTCHTSAGRPPAAGLSLQPDVAYGNLVNVPSSRKPGAIRVIPGDPDTSYLIQKVEGHPNIAGARMPQNGPPYLTSGQILILRRWIELGARDN